MSNRINRVWAVWCEMAFLAGVGAVCVEFVGWLRAAWGRR